MFKMIETESILGISLTVYRRIFTYFIDIQFHECLTVLYYLQKYCLKIILLVEHILKSIHDA